MKPQPSLLAANAITVGVNPAEGVGAAPSIRGEAEVAAGESGAAAGVVGAVVDGEEEASTRAAGSGAESKYGYLHMGSPSNRNLGFRARVLVAGYHPVAQRATFVGGFLCPEQDYQGERGCQDSHGNGSSAKLSHGHTLLAGSSHCNSQLIISATF